MEGKIAVIASPRDFLHVVFKRKSYILAFFAVTVCTVALGTFIAEPIYVASSQILVKMGRENLYLPEVPTGGEANAVVTYNREEQINSEIEILTSTILIEKLVESMGRETIYKDLDTVDEKGASGAITEKTIEKLRKALKVESVKKSNVIKVSFEHTDPQIAAKVTNELVSLYLDRHLDVYKRRQSYKFFQEQSQMLKDKLAQAEKNLQALKKKHNVSALGEERSLLLRQMTELRGRLDETLSHEAETTKRMAQLRQQLAMTPETVPQGENVDPNLGLISTLQTRLVELQLKEKELLNKYTEQSRMVLNVREDIRMVLTKLDEQEQKRYERSSFGPNVTYQRLKEDLFRNERDLEASKATKEILTAQLDAYQAKLEGFNQIERELNRLEEEIDADRQNYRLYLSKFEESRISEAMDAEKIANVTQIQPARPPLKPVSPKRRLNMLLAIFLGGVGGFGLAFLLESFDDRLDRPDVAEGILGLPVLGSIPLLEN